MTQHKIKLTQHSKKKVQDDANKQEQATAKVLESLAPLSVVECSDTDDDDVPSEARAIAEALLGRLGQATKSAAQASAEDDEEAEQSPYDIESALKRAMQRMRKREQKQQNNVKK